MLLNYTPHAITLNGEELPPSGLARCESHSEEIVGTIDGVSVKKITYGKVFGLPAEKTGVYYIVSRIVAEAVKGKRNDCLIVGDTVRNDKCQIIGCNCLCVL